MVSGTTTPIRAKLDPKDFHKKCVEHETFLLHLLDENQIEKGLTVFQSIFVTEEDWDHYARGAPHQLKIWLDYVDLPYYEMQMKEAVEIMLEFGYTTEWIYFKKKSEYWRAILIIHKGKVNFNTQNSCYCFDTLNEAVIKLDPNFFKID